MIALSRLGYIIAVRRIVSGWWLELVLFAGILLAVSLLSSGVIFSNMLAEAALRHALTQATPEQANVWVRVFSGQDAPPTPRGRAAHYRANVEFSQDRIFERFKPYIKGQSRLMETSTFFFQGHPQLEVDNDIRPRGEVKYMTGLAPERSEMVRGRWPYTGPDDGNLDSERPLEVAIDVLGSQLLALDVGDRMEAVPAASFRDPPPIEVEIVGVFQRDDRDDEYWYGTEKAFSFHDDQWTIIPLFTSETAILRQIYERYPTLYTDVTWFYYLDREAIGAGQVDDLLDTLSLVKYDVRSNLNNSSAGIRLDRVLLEYKEQLLLARIPLFLILFLITGILAYFLALITGLVVKSRAVEISILKSRGATTSQVGLLAAVEGLMLSVPAVIIGPLLALGVVKVLGEVFFGLGGSEDLATVPVVLTGNAYLVGLAGGLIGAVVLTGTTLLAARQGIVEFRQTGARPARTPFIHRYYLDLLLLGLIGLLWWQIQSRGAFLVRPLGSRGLEIDYSLLVGPVLLLLAVGLVVMRVFPIGVGVMARISEPVAPAWLVQGLRHVSRDPVVPGSLVVLLMFATALGVIGSAFSSTLERSQRDRALYEAGAALRFEHAGRSRPVDLQGLSKAVVDEGVADWAVEVQRTNSHLTTTGFSTRGTLLAVEAEDFANVAWYRPDFAAGRPLEELTSLLAPVVPERPDGILLPAEARSLTVSVQPSRPNANLSLRARLKDASGYHFDVHIGDLGFLGWKRLEGDLVPLLSRSRRSQDRDGVITIEPPYTLLSLQITGRRGVPDPGAMFFGELGVNGPNGAEIVDGFHSLDDWQIIEDYSRPGLYGLEASESVVLASSGSSARYSWAPGSIGLRGIRPGQPERPLPALVSRPFLEVTDADVGDIRTVGLSTFSLQVEIKAVVDYFPTLDPAERPFAVVDLASFINRSNLHSPRPTGGSNELWVNPGTSGGDGDAVAESLADNGALSRKAYVASDMVLNSVDQPLVNAGWGALLVLMFLALVVASALGVMLFSFIDTKERQTEFALLRTLGSSRLQLNGTVWFSLFLVAVCGVSLGTLAGYLIGISLLPLMEVAEQGAKVTPRMVLETNWVTLSVSYIILGVVTLGTVFWLIWFTARMEIHQVLRIGEA